MSSRVVHRILSFIFMGFYLPTSGVQPAMSQQELCRDAGYVAPSSDMRTVELPKFGIDLNIPENYRTMVRKDGSVEIMDPSHFELVSCIARGGKILDPHGSWGFSIHHVSNPENLKLQDLVTKIEPSQYIKLYKYNLDNTNAVIVHERGRATAYFISPAINKVVAMHVGCDCTVGLEDIVRELNRTRLR